LKGIGFNPADELLVMTKQEKSRKKSLTTVEKCDIVSSVLSRGLPAPHLVWHQPPGFQHSFWQKAE